MWFLLRPLLHILSYWLALYFLEYYNFLWAIEFNFNAITSLDLIKVYVLLWVVFWVWFSIVKKVINVFAFPLQFLTLGLIWFFINILVFYICQFVINTYLTGIEMNIISITWLMVVSFILSISVSFIYWLFKKII